MLPLPKDRFLTGKKVLIAVETKTVRDIVINFCRDKGATEVLFGNGKEMSGQLEIFTPEFVVCEFHMSAMDGVSFCKLLRSQLSKPIPIIMLLSVHDDDGQNQARRAGAVESLTMPFSLNDILTASKRAIERGSEATPSGLRFGPRPKPS